MSKPERLTVWRADAEWDDDEIVVKASDYDALEAARAADRSRIAELESLVRLASDSIVQLSEALTHPSDAVSAANNRGEYEAIADRCDAALSQQGKESN